MKHIVPYLTAAVMLLSSCCFSTEEDIRIAVPAEPNAQSAVMLWTDSANCEHSRSLSLPQSGAEHVVPLTVGKNGCTPVLLQLYAEDGAKLGRPYGMIYPHTLTPALQDGFAAEVLRALYASCADSNALLVQNYLARFNWSRFMEQCRTYDDPWQLDKERIMTAIASGTFKKSDLQISDPEE